MLACLIILCVISFLLLCTGVVVLLFQSYYFAEMSEMISNFHGDYAVAQKTWFEIVSKLNNPPKPVSNITLSRTDSLN